jgi:hypothetical protein
MTAETRDPAVFIWLDCNQGFLAYARDADGDLVTCQDNWRLAWCGPYSMAREVVEAQGLAQGGPRYLTVESVLAHQPH